LLEFFFADMVKPPMSENGKQKNKLHMTFDEEPNRQGEQARSLDVGRSPVARIRLDRQGAWSARQQAARERNQIERPFAPPGLSAKHHDGLVAVGGEPGMIHLPNCKFQRANRSG
jgi:hypothetical protein